ncbi:uncharacterized protein LOC144164418 [Haemaphysalis longicornis]
MLQDELVTAQQCSQKLKEEYEPFGIEKFKQSNDDIQFYTGLPDYETFEELLEFLDPGDNGEDMIRHHNTSTTENEELQLGEVTLWLSRSAIDEAMPRACVEKYASTRVLLDATEIRCEVQSSFVAQSGLYSHYKSTHTFKGLVGVALHRYVTFVSELFTGCTSDRECVMRSGFLERELEEGDSIMADKGFRIDDLLEDIGVKLNIPPFLRREQFTAEETQETQDIAAIRIHVERRIQRIKCNHIFDLPVPMSLATLANQMWVIRATLSNWQSRIMQEMERG